jgi:predicted porin
MKLTKLAIAAAIATTASAPVFAQSSVTVYGKLYPFMQYDSYSGRTQAPATVSTLSSRGAADNTGTTKMQSGNSNIGFRGTEDLGGGMRAIFQLETTMAIENGAPGDAAKFWSRNSFVGLEGGWGTFKAGHFDSVFKEYGDNISFLGVSSGTFMSTSNIMRKAGFGTNNASRFHERVENALRYDSPEIGGFQGAILYSNDSTNKTRIIADKNVKTLSLGVKYDAGPIFAALSYERAIDAFGGSVNAPSALRNYITTTTGTAPNTVSTNSTTNGHSVDTAIQADVIYRINKEHQIEFGVIRKNYNEDRDNNRNTFKNYNNMSYLFAFENKWTSSFTTAGNIVYSAKGNCSLYGGAACSTDGLAAWTYQIGGGYNLSRRTMLFASVAYVKNGASSKFARTTPADGALVAGTKQTIYGVGLSHRF